MRDGPWQLELIGWITGGDLGTAAAAFAGALARSGLPAPDGWALDDASFSKGTPPALGPSGQTVRLRLPAQDYAAVHRLRESAAAFGFHMRLRTDGLDEEEVRGRLQGLAALTRSLLAEGRLLRAGLRRGRGGACLPRLPVIDDATHLAAVLEEEVARAYDDPEAFWEAWDEVVPGPGRRLCLRALDAPSSSRYTARVLRGQMAMARSAKLGTVTLDLPEFDEGELEAWDTGDPTARPVGYLESEQALIFAGWTPPGTELRAADLYHLADLAEAGALPDGSPVREVRVVFPDREQADRAGKLLAAAGVTARWEDTEGEQHVWAPAGPT